MINGLDELERKLGQLAQQSGTIGKKAAQSAIKKVQVRAKYLCPTNEGELRNSIRTSVKQTEGQTEAVCYTNKPYATYVEFGTGPVGQRETLLVYHQRLLRCINSAAGRFQRMR